MNWDEEKMLIGIEDSASLLGMWANKIVYSPDWRTLAERELDEAEAKLCRALDAVRDARAKISGARDHAA